jgi:hypothetical protein
MNHDTDRTTLRAAVLLALFDLARLGRLESKTELVTVEIVAGRIGASSRDVRGALLELDRRELADAGRARLTLRGLALASSLAAIRDRDPLRVPRAAAHLLAAA